MDGPGRKPRVDDTEILDAIQAHDDPVVTAKELSETLPIGRRAVHNRLKDLHEQGKVEKKEVGPSVVWWTV